jgi:hypothetical protein
MFDDYSHLSGNENNYVPCEVKTKNMHKYKHVYININDETYTTLSVTDRGGQYDCETTRLPHFPDNWFTDGGKVVNLTRRPPFTPERFLVLISVRG